MKAIPKSPYTGHIAGNRNKLEKKNNNKTFLQAKK